MGKVMRALGLMSGTSLDGIDVALLETDGEEVVKPGPAQTFAYDAARRQRLASALGQGRNLADRTARPFQLAETEALLTQWHVDAVTSFLDHHGMVRSDIDVVGFHGQTILHRPVSDEPIGAPLPSGALREAPRAPLPRTSMLTVQLGDGQKLADAIGVPVVFDLRANDCANGGQGAPLVPVYHRAITSHVADRPLAIINIGGVANITWIGRSGELIAFDTGPGNALLDDWMAKHAGQARDENGETSARGQVHDDVVRFYLSHAYFNAAPPKSLDRDAFFWDLIEGLSVEDGAATLVALTVGGIAKARELLPEQPTLFVVCGGGRFNRTIMSQLAGQVDAAVVPAEVVGLDGDSIEAQAWAYLAVRSWYGLPITYPGSTGVAEPLTGGVIVRPTIGRPGQPG